MCGCVTSVLNRMSLFSRSKDFVKRSFIKDVTPVASPQGIENIKNRAFHDTDSLEPQTVTFMVPNVYIPLIFMRVR